jgi:hypothetical protein
MQREAFLTAPVMPMEITCMDTEDEY